MYKVMIVDDEPIIKKGLACFVDWAQLCCEVVYEANNGLEAMEGLKEQHIDIVVTDIRMPGLDGLELTRYIYKSYPGIKVIILTAYADFSYAQLAIKYNVIDFIIKTKPVEKIPEAICKAIDLIGKEKEKDNKLKELENVVNDNISEINEKFIKDVMNEIIVSPEAMVKKANEMNIFFDKYFVVVYEISCNSGEDDNGSIEEQNKFNTTVKNFLSIALKDHRHFTAIMKKNLLFSIVSFMDDDTLKHTQPLLITCNEVLAFVENFMDFTLSIGISSMHSCIVEMSIAYNEAINALSKNFYSDNNVSIRMKKNGDVMNSDMISTNRYHSEIINQVQSGNQNSAGLSLDELLDRYKQNEEPIEQVKVSSILLCSQCYRLLANYKQDLPFIETEGDIYKQIQKSKSLQGLTNILHEVIGTVALFFSSSGNKYSDIINKVNSFIQENYHKNIDLQTIADHVFINSSYLSRLYKKETGESIINTINKLKIEKAKKLLKEPSLRIFEIAEAVGINDPAYFAHFFIRYTGISPKEYRMNN